MSKLIIVLVVVVAAGVGFLFWGGNITIPVSPTSPTPTPTPSPVTTPEPSAPTPIPENSLVPPPPPITIEINKGGFSPSTVTIKRGTVVRFLNQDSSLHWPASGVHPVHQVCPGLDALKPIKPGESYSFTFTVAKTCPVHDHLNPGTRGTIVVE